MAKQVPFFLPSSSQDAQKLQMQQMMAQMLMSQQRPQREQTRIVPRESLAASLLPAITQAAGMYMQGKAMKGQEELRAKEYAAILEAMKGGSPQPTQNVQQPAAPKPGTAAAPSDPGVDGGSSPMNPYGMAPALAAHAYQLDPAKYMGEVLSANKPTEFEQGLRQSGFTPEQMAEARRHKFLPAPVLGTDDEREYDRAVKQGYKGTIFDWMQAKKSAPVNVNVNTEKSLYGTMADKVAGQYSDLYAMAQGAPETIARTRRINELLDQVPYTGTAADWKLSLGKAAKAAGFDYAGDDLQNTELLARELGQNVLDNVKSSGLAGSQGLTEGERKFLLQVAGGTIELDDKTLRRVAFLNERTARNAARKWNDTYKRLDQNQMRMMGLQPVDLPEADTPAARGGLPNTGDAVTWKDGSVYEFLGGDPANEDNWRKK